MTDALKAKVTACLGLAGGEDFPELDVWIPAACSRVYAALPNDLLKEDPLAIAAIALVTNDMWNMQSGGVDFSRAVGMILEELAVRSQVMASGEE